MEEYGCVMRGLKISYENEAFLRKNIFPLPFKNFGRLDSVARMTCYAAALALKDAGIKYSLNRKQDIGIIGTNTSGSLQSDINYFRDYLDSGRTLSRGNLFIYTLPTSPLAEAAIYFGLQGPLLYMTLSQPGTAVLLRDAGNIIVSGETSAMLAVKADETEAVCFVLTQDDRLTEKVCNLEEVIAIAKKTSRLDKVIKGCSTTMS